MRRLDNDGQSGPRRQASEMISSLPRDARSVGEIRDEKAPDQIKPQQQHNLGLHTPTRNR